MGNIWSQFFGSLLNALLTGRDQRDVVLLDQGNVEGVIGDATITRTPGAAPPPMWVQARAQIEALQKADPNFLESAFLSQCAKTFTVLLNAEGAMNADAVAGVVTPGFLDKFRQQIADWRNGGFNRVVSDVTLDPPTTFKVTIGGDTQSIMVRFTGSARRFLKDVTSGLLTSGSAQVESFAEFVTFVRPAGSTTPKATADDGPMHCPSCGAPVDSGALSCSYCGASLSGTGGAWLIDRTSFSAYT